MSSSITKDEVRKVILVYLRLLKDKKKKGNAVKKANLGIFFHFLLFAKLSTEKKN